MKYVLRILPAIILGSCLIVSAVILANGYFYMSRQMNREILTAFKEQTKQIEYIQTQLKLTPDILYVSIDGSLSISGSIGTY